jgi:hypothetical protein
MARSRSLVLLVLFLCAANSCNLVLDNEKRSLASTTDPSLTHDAGPTSPPRTPPDAAADSGADTGTGSLMIDGGPLIGVDSGPEVRPPIMGCASPDQLSECTPGSVASEMQGCGLCERGQQVRTRMCGDTCGWGAFSEWSACVADPEACKPGDMQERVGACGPCNTGRLVSHRTCTDSCGWSDWSAPVCQSDPLHCMPGETKMIADAPCGQRCGVMKQMQTCNATCTWDPPLKSACMEAGVCAPGDMQAAPNAGCNPDYCMKGVQPQVRVCTSMCMWGAPINNGTCTIPTGVCRPADLGGMGYRCRPNDPGYRELCNPSSASAAMRCTLGAREPFPSCQ